MSLGKSDSIAAMASLVSYGGGDSDPDSDDDNETKTGQGLVEGEEAADVDIISDDEMPQVQGLAKVADDTYLNASTNSVSAVAFSESIRRSCSTDEGDVKLPPEPTGRCSKHLQDKIANFYKKRFNLNQIQTRKDFRNPSIYEKLISYLRIDELGSNYPTDVFNPHGWDESSYYEALSKVQKEDMAKREKEKKERTKVEFKMGMVKKTTPVPAISTVTTSTGAATTASSTAASQPATTSAVPLLSITTSHSAPSATSDEPERKRKSKWGVVPQDSIRPLLPLPTPIQSFPIAMVTRPQVNMMSALVTNPVSLPPMMPASSVAKTTVIPSVGVLKKPKMEK
ncbi:SAP30-binding protein-like [Acanthaster planci]|uniref:SAP30-binding protein-like n=1 Tax=Acanthaster planci TaxID=133434 RepID=A0A8B7YLM8_ACAPL|nr:SAP30-binding protein-like [Acanthaster planci]XP_022094172.1 SAP30-binding protein-like [Acanthaster planci]XP_022094173.1 SAP30-binding protein-like [Acanthaster planci]